MKLFRRRRSDHTLAAVARMLFGAAGITAALMMLRSLPDFLRYVKMERM